MYTRFLGPAAFGFLMGCAPQPPPRSFHESSSVPPPVEPDFDRFSMAYQPYQRLLQKGVSPAAMDIGCTSIDRRERDAKFKVSFAKDGRLEPCEVEAFALNHWETYPEAAESLTAGPIPWRIQNPETLSRIRKAIEILNQDLAALVSSGLKKDSEKYVRRQMVGLSVFAGFTDRLDQLGMAAQENPQAVEEVVKPLQDAGLIRLGAHLLQKGGLGLAQMTADAPIEATADEALRIKKGWCTEQSKILYAVFREAGLKPFFVSARAEDLEAEIVSRNQMRGQGQNHVYVGVQIQNKSLFADMARELLFVEYPHSIRLDLIHYLAADLSNRGLDLFRTGRLEDGTKLLMTAVHLDPTSGIIRVNLSGPLSKSGRLDEAIRLSREATQLEPGDMMVWSNLGLYLVKKKEFDAAKKVLEEGIRLHPKSSWLYVVQGLLYFRRGDYLVDEESFRLSTIAFQEALKLDPSNVDAHEGLGTAYDKLGRLNEAIAVLEEGLRLNPNNPLLANLLADLRKKREAAKRKTP